jgi:hypothetical protein
VKRTVVRLLTEVVIGGMKYKTHGLMIHVSGVVLFTVLDVKVLLLIFLYIMSNFFFIFLFLLL